MLVRLCLLCATTLLILVPTTGTAQSIPRELRLQVLEAVVQVVPFDFEAEAFAPWIGSGTIISPDGFILTNYHVIGDLDARTHYEWHAVFVTDPAFTDQPPELTYLARYVAADPTHDLALIRIEQFVDGTPVPPGTVFPSVEIGDSNLMLPGDTIMLVGYPGISGSTITFTSGIMSGWLGEDLSSGGKQWIKTDARIAGGNSGGAAFNMQGQLIGVPSAGRTVRSEDFDEEVGYIRPTGLAWSIVGPNVTNVRRASANASPPAAAGASVEAPFRGSGVVGELAIGQTATGTIDGAESGAAYHTYVLDIPPGTAQVVVRMTADQDLDLAAKLGTEIDSYGQDGNWDYIDASTDASAEFVIASPSGLLYVDVFSLLGTGSAASYTLEVR